MKFGQISLQNTPLSFNSIANFLSLYEKNFVFFFLLHAFANCRWNFRFSSLTNLVFVVVATLALSLPLLGLCFVVVITVSISSDNAGTVARDSCDWTCSSSLG